MSVSRFRLSLSRRAQRDMFHILKYSVEMWGKVQARAYQSRFLHAYDLIEANPLIGRALTELGDDTRGYVVGSHIVIYRMRDKSISVIRVLHQNMSLPKHL
jgi:toxin ParE1/3/4